MQETKIKKIDEHKGMLGKKNPNAGRLPFDGENPEIILSKLQEVWAIGGTDAEAAFYANISTATLSRYIDKNPDIAEFRNRLKEKPILKARQTIIQNLDQVPNAQWYLSKKKAQEFGGEQTATKQELHLHVHNEKIIQLSNEYEDKLRLSLENGT